MSNRRTQRRTEKQKQLARQPNKPTRPQINNLGVVAGRTVEISQEQWSGPLPHPGDLEKYDQIVTGSAAKIIEAFTAQSAHRRKQENRLILGQEIRGYIGQVMAFVVALSFLFVAAWLINRGHNIAGTVLGTVDLVGLVALFYVARKDQGEE